MKVLILCGGMGTRLREETEWQPKPMVEIGGKPILWHVMKHYACFGYKDFVLALGYRGDIVRRYFIDYHLMTRDVTLQLGKRDEVLLHGDEPEEDWHVTLADTGQNACKGARIKRVQAHIEAGLEDDAFMLTYADGVSTVDLDALLAFHRSHGRLATVTGVAPTMRFGGIEVREDGTASFTEKSAGGTAWVNGGYYVLERKVFDYLQADDACEFERGALERLSREGQLMMYPHDGFWHCMDDKRDLASLNRLWDLGERPWALWETR